MIKTLLLIASKWLPMPFVKYSFKNRVGSVVNDTYQNQNATVVGTLVSNDDEMIFNGASGSYLNIGKHDYIVQTQIFTLAFWITSTQLDNGNLNMIAGNATSSTTAGFFIGFEDRAAGEYDKAIRCFISKGVAYTPIVDFGLSGAVIVSPDPVHYAVVSTGTAIQIYANGKLVGSRTFTNQPQTSTAADVQVGQFGAFGLNGAIKSGIFLCKKAYTSTQIFNLYNRGYNG